MKNKVSDIFTLKSVTKSFLELLRLSERQWEPLYTNVKPWNGQASKG